MAVRDFHDCVHLAGNTGVVHRHDDLCLVGDGLFDLRLIMFIVSGRISTNTSRAPASTAEVAVLEKV